MGSPRVALAAVGLLGLAACVPSDNRSYGGGDVSIELEADDPSAFSESWQISGLSDAELVNRGKEWQTRWPDCSGTGAWLFVDNDYPFQLRACGDGVALVLDMGRSFELGTTRDAARAGVSLDMAESTDADALWEVSGDIEGATLQIEYSSIAGRYEDDALALELDSGEVLRASLVIDWAFDEGTWVIVPAGEGP